MFLDNFLVLKLFPDFHLCGSPVFWGPLFIYKNNTAVSLLVVFLFMGESGRDYFLSLIHI